MIYQKKLNRKKKGYDKIFIDRSDSLQNHCKLINNNEVIKFLKIRKYKSLKLTNFNLLEQISIFKNCKSIIAPHGAGLTNLAFCKKKTNVIELFQAITKVFFIKELVKLIS